MSKLGVKGGASSGERRYTMRQREVRRGRRGGELYLPFRSSLLVGVLIESASNARLHPRLKSCPSCASRTNEGQREEILLGSIERNAGMMKK